VYVGGVAWTELPLMGFPGRMTLVHGSSRIARSVDLREKTGQDSPARVWPIINPNYLIIRINL